MSASCGKRNRRNRRSHGGAKEAFGASIQEAFQAKPEAFQAKPEAFQAKPEAAQKGGRRKGGKTRKLSKGARAWTQAVTKIYRQMKAKDKTVKLRDAMKRASALKKRGQL
jgi:hypothetical protein